jgi:hypothetical protein
MDGERILEAEPTVGIFIVLLKKLLKIVRFTKSMY